MDKQPDNIQNLSKDDSKDRSGEKLILNGMARDYYQREKLINGLDLASDDDLILISDLDEIPNLDCVDLKKIRQ